jgi:hypothetical protein
VETQLILRHQDQVVSALHHLLQEHQFITQEAEVVDPINHLAYLAQGALGVAELDLYLGLDQLAQVIQAAAEAEVMLVQQAVRVGLE